MTDGFAYLVDHGWPLDRLQWYMRNGMSMDEMADSVQGMVESGRFTMEELIAADSKETDMKQVICPLDGSPCSRDCPDRYQDRPGCTLTTAQEQGAQIIDFGGGNVGMVFLPGGGSDGS